MSSLSLCVCVCALSAIDLSMPVMIGGEKVRRNKHDDAAHHRDMRNRSFLYMCVCVEKVNTKV